MLSELATAWKIVTGAKDYLAKREEKEVLFEVRLFDEFVAPMMASLEALHTSYLERLQRYQLMFQDGEAPLNENHPVLAIAISDREIAFRPLRLSVERFPKLSIAQHADRRTVARFNALEVALTSYLHVAFGEVSAEIGAGLPAGIVRSKPTGGVRLHVPSPGLPPRPQPPARPTQEIADRPTQRDDPLSPMMTYLRQVEKVVALDGPRDSRQRNLDLVTDRVRAMLIDRREEVLRIATELRLALIARQYGK